jgi:DNA-binding response OmpR family regulator
VLLTRREYDLLLFLAGHPGRVFTRPQLLKWVWGYEIVSGERTVDVHIRRLRRKLREHGPTISTIRGIGYRFDDPTLVDVFD